MATALSSGEGEHELRQRSTRATTTGPKQTKTSTRTVERHAVSYVDVLRFAAGIIFASSFASYLVTSGTSLTWGVLDPTTRPWFLDPEQVRRRFSGPLSLTNDELAAFDGSNGSPIYLALNRTIYDVSASPHVYGPGGMYSQLAAKDASRSYITTCFDPVEDLVPYFGGVEEVYVPLWLSRKPRREELKPIAEGPVAGGKDIGDMIDDIQRKFGRKTVRKLQAEAYEKAKEKVTDQVRTWEAMFKKKNYPIIGKVVGVDEEDPLKWRHLGFCEAALKQRPPMMESFTQAMKMTGKGDKLNLNMMGGAGGQRATTKGNDRGKEENEGHGTGNTVDADEKANPHVDNPKANVKLDDMLKGGKYWQGDSAEAMDMEEILKNGPAGGDPARAKIAMEQLRKSRRQRGEKGEPEVPDAVPQAVLNNAKGK